MFTSRHLHHWNYSLILLSLLLLQYCSALQNYPREQNLDNLDLNPEVRRAFTSTKDPIPLPHKRDDSCSADRPCRNGDCCSANGTCGYGPDFCGEGCVSNCSTQAECGIYANPTNKTCPLNACCGRSGICGTDPELCDEGCQSNCYIDQAPGLPRSGVWERVVGYYDIQTLFSNHQNKTAVTPLWHDYTHLNLAYAEINGSSFELVSSDPLDPAMLDHLFREFPDFKSHTSNDLKVFISVQGKAPPVDSSETQAVFSNIAASPHNREIFANNALKFIQRYGFDGIDIHWEYPTANDTANYVELLKQLRTTFDDAGRYLGITFAAPATYQDLRWFDLPNMLKYSDWINLQSYNLRGVYDANIPSQNTVSAHSSLTGLKRAVQLLWRVNIPPAKVVMGLGFFGTSFQLSDPEQCSTPGCPFRSGGKPGTYSNTSGSLAYYEIMPLLNRSDVKFTIDNDDAFVYLTYDQDQWVSYDNGITFQKKLDWADDVGLGGFFIWATNFDNPEYMGHSAVFRNGSSFSRRSKGGSESTHRRRGEMFLGEPSYFDPNLGGTFNFTQDILDWDKNQLSTDKEFNLAGTLVDRCYAEASDAGCTDLHDPTCPRPGDLKVAGEKGKCGGQSYHPVCCPKDLTPPDWTTVLNNASDPCRWSDNRSWQDCAGECNPGEVATLHSSWGGYPNQGEGEFKCTRGYKVLCCKDPWHVEATSGCHGTDCKNPNDAKCGPDEDWVGNVRAGCPANTIRAYCCPKKTRLYDCAWHGDLSDCTNPECPSDELTILTDEYGDNPASGSNAHCNWYRYRSFCCKVRPPPPPVICAPLCQYDPDYCNYEAGYPVNNTLQRRFPGKRGYTGKGKGKARYDGDEDPTNNDPLAFPNPGPGARNTRRFPVPGTSVVIYSQPYLPSSELYDNSVFPPGQRPMYGTGDQTNCSDASIYEHQYQPGTSTAEYDTEHPMELVLISDFVLDTIRGVIPGENTDDLPTSAAAAFPGDRNPLRAIPENFWQYFFHQQQGWHFPDNTVTDSVSPNDMVYGAMGATRNLQNLALTDRGINQLKARVVRVGKNPFDKKKFAKEANAAANDRRGNGVEPLLAHIRGMITVFNYLRKSTMRTRYIRVIESIEMAFAAIDVNAPPAARMQLLRWWQTWFDAYQVRIVNQARDWTTQAIAELRNAFRFGTADNTRQVNAVLTQLEGQLGDIGTLPHPDHDLPPDK